MEWLADVIPATWDAFVDPEGLWTEREHDLAVVMREYHGPLLAVAERGR